MRDSRPWMLFLMTAMMCAVAAGCLRSQPEDSVGSVAPMTAKAEFPDGDPSVPADLGGPGFTGEGWTTASPSQIGDPNAVKGGSILSGIPTWPDNLRMYGIRSNTWLNYLVRGMSYDSMLSMDPRTLEFIPSLASHWKISDDRMTFTFRINPRAHWSDGKPVTTQDVIATYRLIDDDTLLDPMSKENLVVKMHEPVAKSKYIFEVTCKVKHWRNFISMSGLTVLPAHEIGKLTGKEYLDAYNFRYTAVTGPYIIHGKDIVTDESITLTRRKDWWAADDLAEQGLYNFDKIRFVVIRDQRLAFEKACKGELDFASVNTAKWWVEDLESLPAVQNGLLIRHKVYTRFPKGQQGSAVNMRDPPLDDPRIRKALAHLYNRRTMLEKFAYNQYEPLKSYFPSSDGENLDNQMVDYDPHEAARLLAEAGWAKRGPDGILIKDGKRFSVKLQFRSQGFEKYLTVWQEACKQAGVEIKLQLLDPETVWNNLQGRTFELAGINWGAILFPNPRTNWHSTMADKEGSNNMVGFQSEELDALIEQYDAEFDLAKRNELLRQMDGIIFNEHPYVLDWVMPYERFIFWNKFGMPETVLLKYHEWADVFALWWADPDKRRSLDEARKNKTSLPVPPVDVKPWSSRRHRIQQAIEAV